MVYWPTFRLSAEVSFFFDLDSTNVMQPQQQATPQTVTLHHGGIIGPYKDHTALRAEILKREPVEPARSPKQLFITDWLAKHKKKKLADAKEAWKVRCDSKTSFCEKNVEIAIEV